MSPPLNTSTRTRGLMVVLDPSGSYTVFTLAVVVLTLSALLTSGKALATEAGHSDQRTLPDQGAAENGQQAQAIAEGSRAEDLAADHQQAELHCLALNIYFEARSEPQSGQLAVGHVVMNRVAHAKYPDSVCEVVQQGGEERRHRCQFSWWCDGHSDRPLNRKAWNKSLELAQKVYSGEAKDTTGGALWYHATYVKPYWSDLLLKGDRIGQHVFYLENRESSETL